MSAVCPYCAVSNDPVSEYRKIKRTGRFWRKSDGRSIQRYVCLCCKRGFSSATFNECYRQNKRRVNFQLRKEFSSCTSQRRAARNLNINRKTVARKLHFLAKRAQDDIDRRNAQSPLAEVIEFDDMESFEHTKLKPISIIVVIEHKTRRIFGLKTADIPANGKLAARSREKYGPRSDQRKQARDELFERIKPYVHPTATIKSDQHPHYPPAVKKHFPYATHVTYRSRRPRANGQGELKEGGFDPLFSINHTAAMFRANTARLIRKTWNTTKKRANLEALMLIYASYHNEWL